MVQFIKRIGFLTTYKFIDEDKLNIRNIKMNEKDICFFNLSSNPVMSFLYEGELFYFRECPELCEKKVFFEKEIYRFFRYIHQNRISEEHFKQKIPINMEFEFEDISIFQQYINELLYGSNFLKKLARFDIISHKINLSIWENQSFDQNIFDLFGLYNLPKSCYDIAIYFIWYMRNISSRFRNLRIIHGKKHSYFSAVKSISSKIVANAIGLNDMITSADLCRIILDNGDVLYGVLSCAAKGSRMIDCNLRPNGTLQKELTNLNILDEICCQVDHGPNNYNVYKDSKGNYRVCAFDNDNPRTFFPNTLRTRSLAGCTPIINKRGNINRPYFDKKIADHIMKLEIKKIVKDLKLYMNRLQLFSFCYRIRKLKKAIVKTENERRFLIEDDEWNQDTLREEMSGLYGITYLSKAMNNYKLV